MKKVFIVLFLSMTLFCSFHKEILPVGKNFCKTKYPVVLVHGLGFRDDLAIIKYWGKIVQHLSINGAVVMLSRQQAFASHEENAKLIRSSILKIIENNPGYEKVNIIAHSKGGIESRYMIGLPGMEGKVASLTTIATPHRGSMIADMVMNKIPSDSNAVILLVNSLAKLIGDPLPDAYNAGYELTSEYMEKFNSMIKDRKGVYYQSYSGIIDRDFPHPIWKKLWKTLWELDGPNDGLVSVNSARWGEFRGTVTQNGKNIVSHADIIGMHHLTGVYDFNEENFFADVLHDLKNRGF